MTASLTARADVATDAPGRYAKQLVAHLGHRLTWSTAGATSTADIGAGRGTVVAGEGVLTLVAEAPDEGTLARVQWVLGSHLERFGQRNELTATWTRPDGSTAPTPPRPEDHVRPGQDADGTSTSSR